MLSKIKNRLISLNLEKLFPILLITYFSICLLPYIFAPIPKIYFFLVSTAVHSFLRALSALVFFFFYLLVYFRKKPKFDKLFLILSALIVFVSTISLIVTPKTYSTNLSNSVYSYGTRVYFEVGGLELASGFFSMLVDLTFGLVFLFLLPIVANKENIKPFLIFVVVLMFLECIFSLVFEKNSYLATIQGHDSSYAGYDINIKASFVSKNQFGAFLVMAFISSFLITIWYKNNKLLQVFYIFSNMLFVLISILSLCKTAIISILFFAFTYLFFYIVSLIKKRKYKIVLFLSAGLLVALVLFLVISFTDLKTFPVFKNVYNLIDNILIKAFKVAYIERIYTWLLSLSVLNNYHLLIGYPKGCLQVILKIGTDGNNSVSHNGFIQQTLYYGIIGLFLLIYCIFILFRRINQGSTSIKNRGVYYAIFLCVFSFMITETEIIILSSSLLVFLFNIIFTTVPLPSKKKEIYEVKI